MLTDAGVEISNPIARINVGKVREALHFLKFIVWFLRLCSNPIFGAKAFGYDQEMIVL